MKRLSLLLLAVIAAAALAACSNAGKGTESSVAPTTEAVTAAPATTPQTVAPATTPQTAAPAVTEAASGAVTEESAKAAALADAGLSADQVTFTEVKSEIDDGVSVFEISFVSGGTEYDYTVDAATGAILEKESDAVNDD